MLFEQCAVEAEQANNHDGDRLQLSLLVEKLLEHLFDIHVSHFLPVLALFVEGYSFLRDGYIGVDPLLIQ